MSAGSHWRSCRRCVPTATRQPPGNRVQPVDPEEAATRTPCFRTGWPRHAMVSGPDPSKARPLQLRPPPAPGRGGAAPRAQRGARRRSLAALALGILHAHGHGSMRTASITSSIGRAPRGIGRAAKRPEPGPRARPRGPAARGNDTRAGGCQLQAGPAPLQGESGRKIQALPEPRTSDLPASRWPAPALGRLRAQSPGRLQVGRPFAPRARVGNAAEATNRRRATEGLGADCRPCLRGRLPKPSARGRRGASLPRGSARTGGQGGGGRREEGGEEARRRRDRRECGRSQNCCESIVCGARVPRPREDRSAPRARFPGAGKRHQLISRPHRSSPPSLPSPKHTTPRAAAGSTKAHSDPRPRWQAAPRPHGTLGGLWRSASAAGRVRSSSAAGAEERARQDGKGGKVRGKLGTRESAARPARSLTRRRKTPPWSACCDVGASSKNRDGNFCRRVRPPRGPYSPPQGPSKRGSGVKEQSAGRGRDPGAPTSRTNWVARGEGKARSRRASLDGPAGQTTLWPKPGSRRAGAPPCRSERRRGPAVARAGWGQDAPRTARRAAAGTEDGHCRGRPAARVCRRRGSLQPGRGQNLQPGRSQNLQPGRGESPQPGRTCRDAPRPGRGGSLRLRQDVLRPGRG
ncbi:unnamed protein product [Prorocentrum cordatum]|uniref:Collagen alpha-1(I) chain-like n=1 Tax=Prorocentrum cordatum TaxID=2364126 RepID=A0ABN9QGW9_9DINO|nr:unnamed protein product [Polarella glacialis]